MQRKKKKFQNVSTGIVEGEMEHVSHKFKPHWVLCDCLAVHQVQKKLTMDAHPRHQCLTMCPKDIYHKITDKFFVCVCLCAVAPLEHVNPRCGSHHAVGTHLINPINQTHCTQNLTWIWKANGEFTSCTILYLSSRNFSWSKWKNVQERAVIKELVKNEGIWKVALK